MAARRRKQYLSAGPIVGAFLEAAMVQTIGEWTGEPLLLEPWQQDFLNELYLIDPSTGRRVYHTAVLGLPAKQGKSTLSSGIGIHGLIADQVLVPDPLAPSGWRGLPEGSPEVYAAANSRDQATRVFGQARDSIKASPALDARLEVQRRVIYNPANGGIFRALASDSDKVHGVNPSMVIVDELGSASSDQLLVTLQKSKGARRQPLTLIISHVGKERYGPLGAIYDAAIASPKLEVYGKKPGEPLLMIVRDRERGTLFWWYGLQPDHEPDDISDPAVWQQCNPASWMDEATLLKQWELVETGHLSLAEFIRYHLNAFAAASDEFLPPGAFVAAGDPEMVIPRGAKVYLAVDGARKADSGAVGVACPTLRPDGSVEMKVLAYILDHPAGSDSMNERLEQVVRNLSRRWHVAEVHYDPHMFVRSADLLGGEGFEMVEMPQTDSRMVPATKLFRELVLTDRLIHDGDRALIEHVGHAVVRETDRGERIDKRKARHKIDGCVAVTMACAAAQNAIASGSWDDDGDVQIIPVG